MASQSLADRAVSALAKVNAIGENIDFEHPMRHAVGSSKRLAEQIIANAMQQAEELAYQADRLVKDYDEATKGGAA